MYRWIVPQEKKYHLRNNTAKKYRLPCGTLLESNINESSREKVLHKQLMNSSFASEMQKISSWVAHEPLISCS